MREIKQSTAVNVMVFMVDSTDHVTGETGLTLTITASKDGAAFAAISPTVTERGNGHYSIALTTSHTDTLGDLALHITATGADPSDVIMRVIAIDKADSVRAGLTALPNASADGAGGLPISAAGGLDMDNIGADTDALLARLTAARAGYMDNLNNHTPQSADNNTHLATLIGRLTAARAGYLDNLNNHVAQTADHTANMSDLVTRLTAARAGYLDKLNVAGNVASASDVSAITQAQRVRIITPSSLERPDSGSTAFRLWIYAYNEQHQAEDLDLVPTVTAENNAAVDRSSNLGTVTKPGGTTGIYYVDYTVADTHAIEGIVLKVTATEGGNATEYATALLVVDTTAVDFTATDRITLNALPSALAIAAEVLGQDPAIYPSGTLGNTVNSTNAQAAQNSTDIGTLQTSVGNLPGSTEIEAAALAALISIHLDHLLAAAYDGTNKPGDAGALFNEMVEDNSGVTRYTAAALAQAPSGGGGGGGANEANQLEILSRLGTPINLGTGADVASNLSDINGSLPSSGGGTGANLITVTVNDGTNPLESAKVRYAKGVESYMVTTDAAGQALFALDNGTWQVTITLPGYTFTPTTLVVSGPASPTYSMTAVSLPVSPPGQVTGYLYAYDLDGNIASGVDVTIAVDSVAQDTGVALVQGERTATSAPDGLVTFAGLHPGIRYAVRRGGSSAGRQRFTIPEGATGNIELASVFG